MKKVFFLFTLLTMIFVSCAEKNKGEDLIESIKINADKTTITADNTDMVTVTAVTQKDVDVTSRVNFTVNGEKLNGNTFKTDKAGTYKFVATLNDVESNEIQVTAVPKEATLVLTSDKSTILAGDYKDWVAFEVKEKGGKVVTEDCDIFVNGEQVAGHKFRAKVEGEYKAVAKRGNEFSNELTIQANKMQDIILEADKVTLVLDGKDKTTFKVYTKEKEDITANSQIFIGDNPIEGNVFVPKATGKFKATANYKGNKSNQVVITVEEPIKYNLVVKPSKKTLVSDGIDVVSFRCINTLDEDRDLTDEVKFYLDGKELDRPYFNTKVNKEFKITAKFGEETTKEEVAITSQSEYVATPRLYMELFTGTWCPYCPRLITLLEKVCDHPQVVASSLHSGRDPFTTADAGTIGNALAVTGYPTIIVGRDKGRRVSNGTSKTILNMIPKTTPLGIAVYTTISGQSIDVSMTVQSSETFNDLKWVAIVTEDGLHADQANAVYPELGNPIRNMEHRYVYRKTYNSTVWGDPLSITANTPVVKKFTIPLNGNWKPKKCSVFILITKASDNTVLTAQKVRAGEAEGY
ncbi:Omp28-related outer membrane protein [Porphyromonas sp.]|uniref:Omp28-related outer membrane protein n=1 Tax=Porphyromonas sp. TaxID=1924944 RepID=UPI0026DC97D6|nr:Omp28-related outer membrane protein [Porphyromonas sp.]MDO4770347.1 Omp28-related outer membrane protein [Porphyromonas sp.]